ncbi:MAG: hypothetical protein JST00_20005 [Deltaproteobacteria bacterium]|nr:hypothetical protein [Deltaproteobacteria bacterium]
MRKSARKSAAARGVAAACVTAASCGVFALASCTTTLSYVREDAGKDGATDGSTSTPEGGGGDAGPGAGACGRFLLIGGTSAGGQALQNVAIGTISDTKVTWDDGPPLATATSRASALGVDGRVLTAGGTSVSTEAAIFDGQKWSSAGFLPKPGAGCAAGEIQGSVFVVCTEDGSSGAGTTFRGQPFGASPGAWSVVSSAPPAFLTAGAVAVAVGRRFLLVGKGGQAALGTPETNNAMVWNELKENVSPGRNYACAAFGNGHVYLVGGITDRSVSIGTVTEDAVIWEPPGGPFDLPLPPGLGLARAACIVANGRLWVLGGETTTGDAGETAVDTMYSAPINGKTLGRWDKSSGPLPRPVANAAVACLP